MADKTAPISYRIEAESAAAVAAFDAAIASADSYAATTEKVTAAQKKMDAAAKLAAKEQAKAAKEQEIAAKAAEKQLLRMEALERRALKEIEQARAKAEKAAEKQRISEERQAKAAEQAMIRAAKAQAKVAAEAEKARQAASKSFSDIARRLNSDPLISNAEALGSIFIGFGGAISRVSIAFTTMIRPLSIIGAMLGPAAPVLVGLAAIPAAGLLAKAAIGAVVDSLISLGEEAVKVQDEVKGLVPPEVSSDLLVLESGLDAIDKQGSMLTATLASDLSPAINTAIDLTIGLAEVSNRLRETLGSLGLSMETYGKTVRANLATSTMGLSEIFMNVIRLGEETRAKIDAKIAPALMTLKEIEDQISGGSGSGDTPFKRRVKDDTEADREAAKAKKELAEAQKALAAVYDWTTADMLTAEGKIQQAANEQIEKLYEKLDAQLLTEQEVSDAIVEIKKREAREINKLYDDRVKKAFDSLKQEKIDAEAFEQDMIALVQAKDKETRDWQEQREKEANDAKIDAVTQLVSAYSDATKQIADMIVESSQQDLERLEMRRKRTRRALKSATEDEREALEARLENIKEAEEAEKKAARQAFNTSQAAAVASVLASGAAAFVGLLASMAALGPAAPVVAGAIVAPAVAANLAVIGNNKPPAHSGATFGADEFYAGDQLVRRGESAAIFNQRATEQGALDVAEAMNRGTASLPDSRPVQLVLSDAGRVVGEALLSDMSRPGSATRRAFGTAPSGRVNPRRRR